MSSDTIKTLLCFISPVDPSSVMRNMLGPEFIMLPLQISSEHTDFILSQFPAHYNSSIYKACVANYCRVYKNCIL